MCQFLMIFYGPKEVPGVKELGQKSPGLSTRGGRPTPWACPPASWTPLCVSDFNSKSYGLFSVQERSLRRFHSVWTLFGTPFLQNSKTDKKKQTLTLGPQIIG